MVWWTDKYQIKYCRSGVQFGYPHPFSEDRICQTINIIIDFNKNVFNEYDILALLNTGVTVFNIDRTKHDTDFYERTMANINDALEKTEMFPPNCYRPVGLALTMSVLKPMDVDDKIDFLIIKDVTKKELFLDFRERNKNLTLKPILLWLEKIPKEDINELIKISDGVVMDLHCMNNFTHQFCYQLLQICRDAYKPVIYANSDLIGDYYEPTGCDRQVVIAANQLVTDRVDGVILVDSLTSNNVPPAELVLSLVKAIRSTEMRINIDEDYLKTSFRLKVPVLPLLAVAMAASLAALKIKAKAIIMLTVSGRSAQILSQTSPPCMLLAITAKESTARKLHIYKKVMPLLFKGTRAYSWQEDCRNRVTFGTNFALKNGLFNVGAKLVVLAPSEEGIGYCDSFQIVQVPFHCNE